MEEKIIIIDFGSQYTQLIARRVREHSVYCEIIPYNKANDIDLDNKTIKGIILSGSHLSVYEPNAPTIDLDKFIGKVPMLCICYGAQLLAQHLGASVNKNTSREYGYSVLKVVNTDTYLLQDIKDEDVVWMSHSDTITNLPNTTKLICSTDNIDVAIFSIKHKKIYGVQFHPEVSHTKNGMILLRNFLFYICKCKGLWVAESFIDSTVKKIEKLVDRTDKVLIALSGGIDSTVTCLLLKKVLNDVDLKCVLVDNGLLRQNEFHRLLGTYEIMGINVEGIDASKEFLKALKGITNPEEKRKIIGKTFIKVFDEYAKSDPSIKWLAQGTIYPDIVESSSNNSLSETIKSHHNVGGLPDKMKLGLIEPIKYLFKDEVRNVAKLLKVPLSILNRQPFPGPGLAIRIIGEVTPEKIKIAQMADVIFTSILANSDYDKLIWQFGCVLLPVKSVGVKGDKRVYGYTIALRAVDSVDGMTATYYHIPHDILSFIATEIVNRIEEVTRVVYDITSKPPATIEWE
ncbi:MAG: glutamine-hydrolyzing GMP synthase [Solitalea-like symbiont of Tyrophagus putrescentiae]